MINWSYIIAKLISAIGSWLDAANLRNEVYRLKDENEILWTALDDIARMHKTTEAGQYARKTLDTVNNGVKKW
jgi:hypothetical protein